MCKFMKSAQNQGRYMVKKAENAKKMCILLKNHRAYDTIIAENVRKNARQKRAKRRVNGKIILQTPGRLGR